MHPGRVGANRQEGLWRLYQRHAPNDQLDRFPLLGLISKGIWLCNDQATPYLIDS